MEVVCLAHPHKVLVRVVVQGKVHDAVQVNVQIVYTRGMINVRERLTEAGRALVIWQRKY